jgi:protein-tyrosine phosphatase
VSGFTVLTVCTGNICRSPLAEQVLRGQLANVPGLHLASAGTAGDARLSMPQQVFELSRSSGGDPTGHRVRVLDPHSIREAGLVLAMAREHRRDIVTRVPRASRYTFTIREFARLQELVSAEDFREVTEKPLEDLAGRMETAVRLVAMYRGTLPPLEDALDDDVIDPYGRDDKTYKLTATQLMPAVDKVADFIRRAATSTT